MKFQNADIMIVTPSYGGLIEETEACVDKLYEYSKWFAHHDEGRLPANNIVRNFAKSTSPAWVRNSAADMFLESKARSLLMIDRDHIFNHTYLQLLYEADKEIIAALATTKIEAFHEDKKPIVPVCSQMIDGKLVGMNQDEINRILSRSGDKPFEVDRTGMGMILIKRKVFEGIKRPWFAMPESNIEGNPQGCSGEDFYFCQKAKEAGLKIWIHPACPVIHIGRGYYGMGS